MPSCGQGDSRIEDVEIRPAIVKTTVDEAVAPTAWPDGDTVSDEETLIESYEYRSIDFEHTITDETFDPRNPDYRFSR